MSAWIVDKRHIDLMVTGIVEGTSDLGLPPHPMTDAEKDRLGQQLVDECVNSVHVRYPRDDVSKGELPGPNDAYYLKPYHYEPIGFCPSAAEMYSAICCYMYQSCEDSSRWEQSIVKHLLDTAAQAIKTVKPRMELAHPGDIPWGFTAADIDAHAK